MAAPVRNGQRSTKQENRAIVFELLREHGRTDRTELAARSGLSKATVSEIVGALLQQAFIREVGKLQPGRGRSRVLLEFDPLARLVMGAQLGDDHCTVVLADLYAEPRDRATRAIAGTTPEAFTAALGDCVAELRTRATAPILGLGVGVPGSTDPAGRRVTISVPLGWKDVPIADLLEERLRLPVLAANRAKVAAVGEVWRGAHEGVTDLVYVFVGNGIVAGIVADGALFFGSAGGAGELGHVTVLPDGPACGCGNRGCLHMLASQSAIVRLARTKACQAEEASILADLAGGQLGQVTLDLVLQAAERGDASAREALAEAGTYLGLAIANLVNLINPQRVIVGGPVAGAGDLLLEPLRGEVRRRALWDALAGLSIVPSALGDDAGTSGAAALFLHSHEASAIGGRRRNRRATRPVPERARPLATGAG